MMTRKMKKQYACEGQISLFDMLSQTDQETELSVSHDGKTPASIESRIAQIARLEANSSVSKDYIDSTREYYNIPNNGEIIYFESGLTVYQAKVIECVENSSDTYIRVSAGGHEWQIRRWFDTREDAEKETAKTWQGKIKYQPLPKSERPKKSEQNQIGSDADTPAKPEMDCSHCDGCEYRDAGGYEVDEFGYTWKYNCPGTASANWPRGTPMNVSAPLVEYDGHYYEDNVVDGIPHIFCWKKAGAKRYLNKYQVKEALEDAIGKYMSYDVKSEMFNADVNGYMFSFEIDTAEFENQNTKEGDDIISVSICRPDGSSYGCPCESIEEAVKRFEFYFKQANTICKHSKHECNKEELWKVADSLDAIQCPHVCCRKCATQNCGVRCNGSSEPPKVRLWHRLCKMKPEQSGEYEIMDIDGKKGKAWYESSRGDFDHVTGKSVECWRENG